jgi:hypothetical protein
MATENSISWDKLLAIGSILNLVLILVSNLLVFWTWYNIITTDSDTMFLGLLVFPLILVTIYYLALLKWGIRLVRQRFDLKNKRIEQSLTLFILNIVPMSLIYYFTT